MRKKLFLIAMLVGLVVLLSGCTEIDQPITSDSEGIWNTYFVYPLSWLLEYFAGLFDESYGYGLAIIILTVLIRTALLPLNIKQLKSQKAMQEIQPELKELQQKYSSKDANTQQKLQQETMALFQKHGANPLAGCLPIFIQMPILLAIYHAIMRTQAIDGHSFLWFPLDEVDYVLPIIAGLTTFLQQKLMMSGSAAANNPQMTVMLYVMPIMIAVFAFFFPAALALYWVIGNLFMIAQTIFIRKPMMKDANTGGDKK